MARFTFTIESEDEGEMSGLMVRLFAHTDTIKSAASKVKAVPVSTLTHPADDDIVESEPSSPEPVRRTRRTKAEMAEAAAEPSAEVDVEGEEVPATEVTLDMVKAEGSKAMGTIKASGVTTIFAKHGGGAETFAALKPQHYAAVHDALVQANG